MNSLAIDFGTKNIGLAYTQKDIVFTLPTIPNDSQFLSRLQQIINDYQIGQIFVGLSEGKIAKLTNEFIDKLKTVTNLSVQTVEESVSTIEANQRRNKNQSVDSFSAAIILGRALGYN